MEKNVRRVRSEVLAEKLLGLVRERSAMSGSIEHELAVVAEGDPFVDGLRAEAIQVWNTSSQRPGVEGFDLAARNRLIEIVAALRIPLIVRAHDHSIRHRLELESSAVCGCFHCARLFGPAMIEDWVDDDNTTAGQTALCPHCGIDAVIGDASGYPVTVEFLRDMRVHWF